MNLSFNTTGTESGTTFAEDYKNLLPQVRLDIEMIKRSGQANLHIPRSDSIREIKNSSRDFFEHSAVNAKLVAVD